MKHATDHDRPVTGELYPLVHLALVGSAVWLALSVWRFAGGGYADLSLAGVSCFVVTAVAIPAVLWWIWCAKRPTNVGEARQSIHDWASGQADIRRGRLKGTTAAGRKRGQMALLIVASFFVIGATRAVAGNDLPTRNVIRPYYYQGAGKTLNTIDQQQLTIYRDQLEVQQRAQQLKLNQGSSRPVSPLNTSRRLPTNPAIRSRNLFETQSELNRVNGMLNSAHTAPLVAPMPPSGSSGIRPLGFSPSPFGASRP